MWMSPLETAGATSDGGPPIFTLHPVTYYTSNISLSTAKPFFRRAPWYHIVGKVGAADIGCRRDLVASLPMASGFDSFTW